MFTQNVAKTVSVYIWYMQQANTADMLDLAVDYIKELQKQSEVCLSEKTGYQTITVLYYIA